MTLFPTITAAHWRESIARARATPNTVRERIKAKLMKLKEKKP